GGSTASGMLLMAKQFDAEVAGVGIFIESEEPEKKAIPEYRSLLTLSHKDGCARLRVTETF
ncbi:MAG: pur operon repressor, partial [Cloacibacillus sp.]